MIALEARVQKSGNMVELVQNELDLHEGCQLRLELHDRFKVSRVWADVLEQPNADGSNEVQCGHFIGRDDSST